MPSTAGFVLDVDKLHQQVAAARSNAAARTAWEDAPVQAEDLPGLWHSSIPTDVFYQAAAARRQQLRVMHETFSPLYMTNTCDAECRMCGMRRSNAALIRETARLDDVIDQLRTLARRGMHAVALLTGEYRQPQRQWAMGYVNQAARAALELSFRHVLINVGSIDEDEFPVLLEGVERREDGSVVAKLTMSTFQETYEPGVYAKFMGNDPENPRADFERRLVNFDRAFAAGMRVANPGILVGLNPDIAYEMTALALHSGHLIELGMEVYLSMPRLRRIAGEGSHRTISDDEYLRMVSLLSLALPQAKPVITTREGAAMQQQLAPIVTVISAGSASVTPYTQDGARFPLETSQFEVIDQRPFEAILADHRARGLVFENFVPAH
ncbi:MAG TPA: hypothetical protein VEB21_11100 [Terriglobales bacterium]|nr:hypothetical protein [Terriglobales bacterium]